MAVPNRATRLRLRVIALLFVGGFAGAQCLLFRDGLRNRDWLEPTPVLGPLYYLANKSPADDWLGIMLLIVLVPCILSFAVWPTRVTALLAVAAIMMWIGPGVLTILQNAP
jgi:hypothetical protein